MIDAGEEDTGDCQRNTQVDRPPRVHLDIRHSTELQVGTPITVHCKAGQVRVQLNTHLIGGQVSGHVAYFISVRWIRTNTKPQSQ